MTNQAPLLQQQQHIQTVESPKEQTFGILPTCAQILLFQLQWIFCRWLKSQAKMLIPDLAGKAHQDQAHTSTLTSMNIYLGWLSFFYCWCWWWRWSVASRKALTCWRKAPNKTPAALSRKPASRSQFPRPQIKRNGYIIPMAKVSRQRYVKCALDGGGSGKRGFWEGIYLRLGNSMFISLDCKLPKQKMKSCSFSLLVDSCLEWGSPRKGVRMQRGIKMVSNQELQ